jgi:hypothetical protein
MSPEGPRFHSSETDKDEKDKKRKKRASFVAPIPLDTSEKPAEKPRHNALNEAMDKLDATKQEAAEKKATREAPEGKKPATEAAESAGTKPKAETPETPAETENADETYEKLPNQTLAPNEFSGGEVIIRLQGDEPVAERVIPLHDESAGEAPEHPERPEPAEEPQPVFAPPETPEPQPEPVATGSNGEPPPPPPEAPTAASEPPEPERSVPVIEPPVEVLRPESAATLPRPAPAAAERPATKAEVEDALHRSAKIHAQRGALSGLLVGTWFANRGLRRRQKQERAELNRQGKQLEQVTKELHAVHRAQESQRTNTERRFSTVEKRFENPSRPQKTAARAEKPEPTKEPAEQLEIPKDHHLETSAWHTIEVDSKTGKPVENPTFAYGHEYYQERAHEAAPKDQRNAAAGEIALVAAAMAGESGTAGASPVSSAHIPLATTQGAPHRSAAAKQTDVPAKPPTPLLAGTGPLWPWVAALVVIIILLAVVIH